MSYLQLRHAALRLGGARQLISRRVVTPQVTAVKLDQKRCFSVKLKKWQDMGFVDEKGLTVFDTLHEMQIRSCLTYAQNDLFGTFSPGDGKVKKASFEWMTFEEYSTNVDKCRTILKDLGTF